MIYVIFTFKSNNPSVNKARQRYGARDINELALI